MTTLQKWQKKSKVSKRHEDEDDSNVKNIVEIYDVENKVTINGKGFCNPEEPMTS
jgi:hypothetical protein